MQTHRCRTFVYNPAAGSIPAIGTDALSVTFTPTDAADSTAATATVMLTVNQPSLAITDLSPALISKGSAGFTLTSQARDLAQLRQSIGAQRPCRHNT